MSCSVRAAGIGVGIRVVSRAGACVGALGWGFGLGCMGGGVRTQLLLGLMSNFCGLGAKKRRNYCGGAGAFAERQ